MNPVEDYIPISHINDFLFCPYSIYLHSVYGAAEEEFCKAVPQKAGTMAHEKITRDEREGVLHDRPVRSEELGIAGIIDEFDTTTGTLTEYKNRTGRLFPGQFMQLYGQYFCLLEEGLTVNALRFVEISSGKETPVPLPGKEEEELLSDIVERIGSFSPSDEIPINPNKCSKCIYCMLCEKTDMENDF